jgi:K+-transporting ATPase A subunit
MSTWPGPGSGFGLSMISQGVFIFVMTAAFIPNLLYGKMPEIF